MFKRAIITAAFAAFMIFSGLFLAANAEAGAGCGGDCADCHDFKMEEAQEILKTDAFKFEILDIRMSPVKGLWQVEIKDQKGKKGLIYVDFAKQFVIQGKFIKVADIGKGPKLKKIAAWTIPLDDALVIGNKEAEKRIIVFDDPDCPYCKKLHADIKKIVEERDDLVFYIKMYPLPMHKEAYKKSKAIVCEKSLELLDDAFAGKELPEPSCETDVVDKTIELAKSFNINGTPAIILPDDRLLVGYVDAERLKFLIDMKPEEEEEEEEE